MDFLDKQSKLTLRALNKEMDDNCYVDKPELLLNHLPKDVTRLKLDRTLAYLEEKGYIICSEGYGTVLGVSVEYTAEKHAEIKRNEIKKFLLESIYTPIVVSTITTLVTIFIHSLF